MAMVVGNKVAMSKPSCCRVSVPFKRVKVATSDFSALSLRKVAWLLSLPYSFLGGSVGFCHSVNLTLVVTKSSRVPHHFESTRRRTLVHDLLRRALAFASLISIGGIHFSCRTLLAVSLLVTMPQEQSATSNRHE